jgi:ribosomal protein S18 acetylase RimI-like enzyme
MFALPPHNETEDDVLRFREQLARHTQRTGFRCVIARDSHTASIVGFAYGYTGAPGQWWHDIVVAALGPQTAKEWLTDCFEFVEIAVTPLAQGHGIGGQLHDQLLNGLQYRTAVLSTRQEETFALRLYRNRGWVRLNRDFVFPNGTRPCVIMGYDLSRRVGAQSAG